MAKIDAKVTEHVADLIKIYLDPAEIKLYNSNLNTAIGAVETFSELDTDGVDITAQTIGTENIMREDEVIPSFSQKEALANAPHTKNGYFVVTRVLKDE